MRIRWFALVAALSALSLFSNTVMADPPPWAPAHGYYKNKGKHKPPKRRGYDMHHSAVPPGGYIEDGHCRREAIGQALGAILGGVAGAEVGDREPVAIIAGAIIGFVLGGSIGRAMDERDRACVGQALEYAEDQESIRWQNPDTGVNYRVTPTRTFSSGNAYCREYVRTAIVDAGQQKVHGKACREADGALREPTGRRRFKRANGSVSLRADSAGQLASGAGTSQVAPP